MMRWPAAWGAQLSLGGEVCEVWEDAFSDHNVELLDPLHGAALGFLLAVSETVSEEYLQGARRLSTMRQHTLSWHRCK